MRNVLLFTLFCLLPQLSFADNEQWNLYLSYSGKPQDIESADRFIYVLTNNNVYSYNRNDHSITTFSRKDVLSDVGVQFIAWAKAVRKLVVVYENGNMDLLGNDGTETENIPDYFLRSSTDDKTINSIYVKGDILMLATNLGIVKINLRKAEIMETYRLQQGIQKAAYDNDYVYGLATDNATLYKGLRTKNLIDPAAWTKESWSGQVDFSTENDVIKPEDEATVNTLSLDDSPQNNQISQLLFDNDRLIVAAGGWRESLDPWDKSLEPTMSELKDGKWTHYDKMESAAPIAAGREVMQIAVNPADPNQVVAATNGNGIYEYYNGKLIKNHTLANTSVFESAAAGSADYVIVSGATFKDNEMLLLNSYSAKAMVKYNISSKTFSAERHKELIWKGETGHAGLGQMRPDSQGLIWFVNDNWTHPSLFCYNKNSNTVTEYNTFINQDGTNISDISYVHDVAEDLEGNIWAGTSQGPLMLTRSLMSNPKDGFIQVKVPRKDGTSYADYLLAGVDITSIAIDGAGRKWFGTPNNGVYLISADNMDQISHFTKENSLLLDNDVRDIAINPKSGEVFFATNKGLCSCMGGATRPNDEMTKDNVWAYPNPVGPEYTGEITITGLSLNARITITTTSGHLVASGTSTGGTFKWNGCDTSGKRVASGIYMVHTATSNGESGVVCKVAIIR